MANLTLAFPIFTSIYYICMSPRAKTSPDNGVINTFTKYYIIIGIMHRVPMLARHLSPSDDENIVKIHVIHSFTYDSHIINTRRGRVNDILFKKKKFLRYQLRSNHANFRGKINYRFR